MPRGNRCPRGDDCLAEKARHQAAEADILVVNLHLYALAITVDAVLPEHDLVMIDEAHQLEDIVAEAAGRQISPARVQAAARNTASVLVDMEPSQRAEESATSLHVALEPLIGERLLDGPDAEVGKALDDVRAATERLLDALRAVPESAPADTRTKAPARQVATGLIDDIDAVRWPTDSEVMWVDGPASNPGLRSTPIAVDSLLSENLWAKRAAYSRRQPCRQRRRVGSACPTTRRPSTSVARSTTRTMPSSTARPTSLILGTRVPQRPTRRDRNPDGSGWRTHACAVHVVLGDARSSRTTRRSPPWKILMQGDGAKNALLRDFVEDEETSLFATMSFWQGVDAPGRTCSLVIIDRIPFPRPNEPVLQARRTGQARPPSERSTCHERRPCSPRGPDASSVAALTAVSSPSSTPA